MRSGFFLSWARRHTHWLLCLALLLPTAQLAAAAHVLSHAAVGQKQRNDAAADALDPCKLCAQAAAVAAGGFACTPATHQFIASLSEPWPDAPTGRASFASPRLFDSRGPPAACTHA